MPTRPPFLTIATWFTLALVAPACAAAQHEPPRVEAIICGAREEMPLFGGHDTTLAYPAAKRQADSLLLTFVYERLDWSRLSVDPDWAGVAVVSFVVDTAGQLGDLRLVRDPGHGSGAEALRVLGLLRDHARRRPWAPGRQAGRPVRVQFNLPVKFAVQ